jgi:hypothetical protein
MCLELQSLSVGGDTESALDFAEAMLALKPDPNVELLARGWRAELERRYAARLGSLALVPVVKVAPRDVSSLALDSRAGFVLFHVDGESSFEMILDACSMPKLAALRVLCALYAAGIIGV